MTKEHTWRAATEAAAKVADERAKRLAEGGARLKGQGEHVAAYACEIAEAEAVAMARAIRALTPPNV